MKIKNKMYLLMAGILVFFGVGVNELYAKPFNIGIIEDCSSRIVSAPLLEKIKAEIKSLTRSEFDVRFPKNKYVVAQCNSKSIQSGISKLMNDPGVDLVMSLGHLGSYYLCKSKTISKPTIAGVVLNPELQGIPFRKGKSGRKDLTYIAFLTDFKKNIDALKEVVPFQNAAYIYDKNLKAILPTTQLSPAKLEKRLGTKLTFIPVGKDIDSVLGTLDNRFDAVFVGTLQGFSEQSYDKVIAHLKDNKLPGFSFLEKKLVTKGLLAGFDRSKAKNKYVRRMGLLVQRVLLGDSMAEIPVNFTKESTLVINMQTAKEIGVSPSFAVMAKADVINMNSLVGTSTASTEMLPLAPVALGPMVLPAGVLPAGVDAAQTDQKDTSPSTIEPIAISPAVSDENIMTEEQIFQKTQLSGDTLTLLNAVKLTLKNNPALIAKKNEVAAGEMNVKDALSQLYPQIVTDLTGRVIDEETTSALSGVAERAWDITAQVNQIIYSDKARTNLKTSRHYQKALELSENQDKLDAVLATCISYLELLKARANARIQLENLKLIRSNLNLANNRYKAGASGPSDVYRLESQATSAYTDYLNALAKISASKIHLHQLMDMDLEKETLITDIGLDDNLFLISTPQARQTLDIRNPENFKIFRNHFVKKGLEYSPELAAMTEQILAQKAVYGYAKRAYWSPDVSLFSNVGRTFSKSGEGSDFDSSGLPSSISSYFDDPSDSYWKVGVNVTLPLYEGGAKSALKIKSLKTTQQLVYYKKQLANLISENIRMALVAVGASFPSIELTRLSAASAKKNLDLVVDLYAKGSVAVVDLLDAQNAFLNASTLAENAVYDFFVDYISAERASGRFSLLMDAKEKEQWLIELQR
ncbi:MAG: ABC transporter substrate binding protein [Desulfobacterium sp.]